MRPSAAHTAWPSFAPESVRRRDSRNVLRFSGHACGRPQSATLTRSLLLRVHQQIVVLGAIELLVVWAEQLDGFVVEHLRFRHGALHLHVVRSIVLIAAALVLGDSRECIYRTRKHGRFTGQGIGRISRRSARNTLAARTASTGRTGLRYRPAG